MSVNLTSLKAIYTWAFKNKYFINRVFDSYTDEAKNPDPIRSKPNFDDMINFYYTLHDSSSSYDSTRWLKEKYPEQYAESLISPSSTSRELKKLVANFQYENEVILGYDTPTYPRYGDRYTALPMVLEFKKCDSTVTIYDYLGDLEAKPFKLGLVKKKLYIFKQDQKPYDYRLSELLTLGVRYPTNTQLLHLIKTYYRTYSRTCKYMFKDELINIYSKAQTPYQQEQCLLLCLHLLEPNVFKRKHAPLKDIIALANTLEMPLPDIIEHVKNNKVAPNKSSCPLPTFD